MQFMSLDNNFNPLSVINPINVQWNRKYYECGDFSIQILKKDYNNQMAYIYTSDRDEMGIIQKIEATSDINGELIQMSGFFLEKILNDRIIYPTYNKSGNIEVAIRDMVNTYKTGIPLLQLGILNNLGSNIEFQETGSQLSDKCYEILKTQQLSYKCKYDYLNNKINFEVYQGKDRTQSQPINNFVVFSTKFKNINNSTIITDISNYKNYAIVGGSGEGTARIYHTVDLAGSEYQRQIFIDARDLTYNSSEQTLAQYKDQLYQRGLEKLFSYKSINNITFDTVQEGFIYLNDYNLGDLCDVLIDDFSLSLQARIIGIYEVFKNNTHTIELEFGDKILTNFEKMRL